MLRPTAIATALQALLAGALCFVPLFNLLGYEFCLATTLLAVFTGHAIGREGAMALTASQGLRLTVLRCIGHLLPSLGIIMANALRVKNCDLIEGLVFWCLLPLPTALYAGMWGLGVGTVVRSPARRHLASSAVILLPLSITLWRLYWQPPVFAYDHLWGWFAGSLYDESISPQGTLVRFRGLTLARAMALGACVLAYDARARRGPWPLAIAGLALGLLVAGDTAVGPKLGFAVTREDVLAELSVEASADGVVVHLPKGTDPDEVEAVLLDHRFRIHQVRQRLGMKPSDHPPIHSYVYANRAQKMRLMGAALTQVTKPWLREIHIDPVHPRHPVLAHELVHVLSASFGDPLFGISLRGGLPNMTLVEGLAEAVTLEHSQRDLHSDSRAMQKIAVAPDLRRVLVTGSFWGHAPQRVYTLAGSFVRHLIETRGIERFKAAYANGDLGASYQEPVETLIDEWETMLRSIELLPRDERQAEHRFRTTSIFAKPCAHVVATLRQSATSAPPERAVELYQEIATLLGNAPHALLDVVNASLKAGDEEFFLQESARLLADGSLTGAQVEDLLGKRGEIYWKQGRLSQARQAFERALDLRVSLPSERLNWVRRWALDLPEADRETIRLFLTHKLKAPAAILELASLVERHPEEKTFAYLLARQLNQHEAYRRGIDFATRAGPHPFAPIEAERLNLLASMHLAVDDHDAAQRALLAYHDAVLTSGERAQARDALERVRFIQSRVPPLPSTAQPMGE